ncbi:MULTISPECIES: nitroreductase/quinone reductase family protein [unclassified Mycobacteroides]|uniref:nitroreductase/quinone reductase family protein n=1 Tax=unclassified Mycobacteroides TaxID=2618759 RepID=UPI000A5AA510|nr:MULTISPECIES: nitroreductase/quinone reductase family protein [unclassified Mycobacteroides]
MPENVDYAPSPRVRERAQVELYEATAGEAGGTLYGSPVVILSHRGATSGLLRKTPLIRIERNGVYAVIATNGGGDRDPLWVRNIAAHPDVTIQDRAEKCALVARRLRDDEEKELWWKRGYSVLPKFAEYRAAIDRGVPVLVLEPATAVSGH